MIKRIVGFSGGIDSQATALWVRQRFPVDEVLLLNSDPGGNEHPLTTEFLEWYSANVFPVIVVRPIIADLGNRGTRPGQCKDRRSEYADDAPMSFGDLAYIKGRFPASQLQFCTEHLKLAPQKRWIAENLIANGIDYERYAGVRRDESRRRSDTPDRKWDDYFDCEVIYPVASWTKKQCFDFVLEAGEQINPLYTLGFSRVGCAPCVNSSKEDIVAWATRFPEMIDKVRAWEEQVGRTFFPPMLPNGEYAFIDEVVKWAKTVRGGRQIALPFAEAEAASGACSSKYGLCE